MTAFAVINVAVYKTPNSELVVEEV
jgi:hypothetical protein